MRAGEKIYADLNRPARVRPKRVHERPIRSSRWDAANGRTLTDARRFTNSYRIHDNAEDVISATRRRNVEMVQRWIDENDPSPFEILRKIASVSQPHRKLLTTISEELEKIILRPRPPPTTNIRARDVSAIKLESRDVQNTIDELNRKHESLVECLEQLKEKKQKLQDELATLKRAAEGQTFAEENKTEQTPEPIHDNKASEALQKRKRTKRFNELWGENRHLRTELERVSARLTRERELHDMYAEYRASAIVAAKQVQSVETDNPNPGATEQTEGNESGDNLHV